MHKGAPIGDTIGAHSSAHSENRTPGIEQQWLDTMRDTNISIKSGWGVHWICLFGGAVHITFFQILEHKTFLTQSSTNIHGQTTDVPKENQMLA
jgi:hypothetical protein